MTISQMQELVSRGEATYADVVGSVLERIDRVDDSLRSFISVTRESALAGAKDADAALRGGDSGGPLLGAPMAIKDIICTKGIRTTCGSKILGEFHPPYDATVIARLNRQGVVMVGKANMDEFGMGSSTETSHFFTTRNPWDLDRTSGGSSGGPAAAVSADECMAALGSDTGGSIRLPAAFCSVVGLKPTYGRVSRYGLVAYASSLDQIGPITKDVRDCAIVLKAIAGWDRMDSTVADVPVPDYPGALVNDVRGLKIGIPAEYFTEGLDPQVGDRVTEAVKLLETLGASVEEIALPHTEYAIATYYILATAEASSNLARYDGVKYGYRVEDYSDLRDMYHKSRSDGFGVEVKRRIMLGTYALSAGYYDAYYEKAQRVRTLIKNDFEEAFKKVDVLAAPTSPTPPFKLGEKLEDPLQMYLSDIYTISANLAGIPAISIPCGFTGEDLPVGMQIMGKPFAEETVLRTAYTFEQNSDHHQRKPPL